MASLAESLFGINVSELDMKTTKDLRILVVDDNPINQRLASLILRRFDLKFDLAFNGTEAIQMYQQNAYDLIFMDLQMPDMDGMEASRQIRSLEKETGTQHPVFIIALSANEAFEKKEQCLKSGMDDFMEKPFQPHKLSDILEKLF